MGGEQLRRALPHERDAQSGQYARQRLRAGMIDVSDYLGRGFFTHAVKGKKLIGCQGVQVSDVFNYATFQKLI